jgi:hypothetical protein
MCVCNNVNAVLFCASASKVLAREGVSSNYVRKPIQAVSRGWHHCAIEQQVE